MLEHLFDAELVCRSEMEPLTRDGEGELIGSGDGSVLGEAIGGRARVDAVRAARQARLRNGPGRGD